MKEKKLKNYVFVPIILLFDKLLEFCFLVFGYS